MSKGMGGEGRREGREREGKGEGVMERKDEESR